jgi:hypothetical protein
MSDGQDPYELLQVSPNAEPEVIQAAYRRLSRKYHPDVDSSPAAGVRQRALNAAFELLNDPLTRAAYDRRRTSDRPPNPSSGPRARNEDSTSDGPPPESSPSRSADTRAGILPRITEWVRSHKSLAVGVVVVGLFLTWGGLAFVGSTGRSSSGDIGAVEDATAGIANHANLPTARPTLPQSPNQPIFSAAATVAPQNRMISGNWEVADTVTSGVDEGTTYRFSLRFTEAGAGQVSGEGGNLSVAGILIGDVLHADFARAGGSGHFDWSLSSDGLLKGTYEDVTAGNRGVSIAVPSGSAFVSAQTFSDRWEFCKAFGDVGMPIEWQPAGAFYNGPAWSGSAQAPTVWRCSNGLVMACVTSASIAPCGTVDRRALASPELIQWCAENPGSQQIPLSVAGHMNAYEWGCAASNPFISKTLIAADEIDAGGYRGSYWKVVPAVPLSPTAPSQTIPPSAASAPHFAPPRPDVPLVPLEAIDLAHPYPAQGCGFGAGGTAPWSMQTLYLWSWTCTADRPPGVSGGVPHFAACYASGSTQSNASGRTEAGYVCYSVKREYLTD